MTDYPNLDYPCPSCEGATLVIIEGAIECSNPECDDRLLLDRALRADQRHYVTWDGGFILEHPLSCRARGLTNCSIHKKLADLDAPPPDADPARRSAVSLDGGRLAFGDPE